MSNQPSAAAVSTPPAAAAIIAAGPPTNAAAETAAAPAAVSPPVEAGAAPIPLAAAAAAVVAPALPRHDADLAAMHARGRGDYSEARAGNTKAAYASYVKFWFRLHDVVPSFGADDPLGQAGLLTEDKAFKFCWINAYRRKRPANKSLDTFTKAEWDEILLAHPIEAPGALPAAWIYNKVQATQQAVAAIKDLAQQQEVDFGLRGTSNVVISQRIRNLTNVVANRTEKVRRAANGEKVTG